jgi:short-subunit dehydrogenase
MRKRVYANLRKRDKTSNDPIEVAKTVLKIIEAPKPKLHYAMGINKSTLWLMKLLPKSTVENQTRRMFDV